jgi:hypothetical protein
MAALACDAGIAAFIAAQCGVASEERGREFLADLISKFKRGER